VPHRFERESHYEQVVVTRIYISPAPINDGEACMSNSLFAIAMVVLIGLLSGIVVGLLIGFLAKKQRPLWSDMTRTEKWINILLVGIFSAIFIAALAWGFLLQ